MSFRIKILSGDSDASDSISKFLVGKQLFKYSLSYKSILGGWRFSREYMVTPDDLESLADFLKVYGYTLVRDKSNSTMYWVEEPIGGSD